MRSFTVAPYADAIAAARTCYSSRVIEASEVNDGHRARIGPLTYNGGHHTVYQHATFEFALSGVSRQLVWSFLHGFPFYNSEQQSQRYVRMKDRAVHIPPALAGAARARYLRSMDDAWRAYEELARLLEPRAMALLSELWRLPTRKNPAFAKKLAREAEKKALETARYVLPIACHTALVYTISGLTLHRLRRMASVGDVPDEAKHVVARMVELVRARDPDFFAYVGEATYPDDAVPEFQAPPGDPLAVARAFDESLEGRHAKLVDWSARAPEVVAQAVRHVLGTPALSDAEAFARLFDPAQNPYRLEHMNVSTHSPLMRAANHAYYTFRKKLSHTADSQDQRHRMVPGSRPLLSRTVPDTPDVIEPALIAEHADARRVFREIVEAQWDARAELLRAGTSREHALYVLPNALALRFEESGSLLHLMHKWTQRTCLNAQREIYDASLDEMEQVRALHPQLMEHMGPPCVVRSGHVRPRCTEGTHFCGVPVWTTFPEVERVL